MAATRNILHSCSLIDNKLVSGQWPYVDKKFTIKEYATHYIATRCRQLQRTHPMRLIDLHSVE
jgi:hypothetical protein